MADELIKVTDLTELTTTPANGDYFHIVDVDDITDDPAGTSKKVKKQNVTPNETNHIKDTSGNELLEFEKTASAVNHVKVKNASAGYAAEIQATGSDANVSLKNKGKGNGVIQNDGDTIELVVVDFTVDLSVGDGKAYVTIPTKLHIMLLDKVHARVITAGTTGTTDIQIHNVTDGVDMLSTKLTIDSGEVDSELAAAPAVINPENNDVATNDLLRIDVDAVSTTAPKGLLVRLEFRNP